MTIGDHEHLRRRDAAEMFRTNLHILSLKVIGEGDVLIVSRLDRLARSTKDFLNIVAQVIEAGATFKSIKESWADTTTPCGRLMLTILSMHSTTDNPKPPKRSVVYGGCLQHFASG
jgi:hypothetical protein